MNNAIEYSGGSAWGTTADQASIKTRNAPRWWLEMARRTSPAASPARPPARPAAPADARRSVGWLAGTCCPGVSEPARSQADGKTLPEQFTDACWRSMLRQTQQQERPIALTWDHYGPVIATTRNLDVLYHIKYGEPGMIGLEFECRLPDTELGRQVLAAAAEGLGVSIGYHAKRQWHVERDGIGTVRVVDDAVLDHVAVLPGSATQRPAFSAARCFAGTGRWMACPVELPTRARLAAWDVLKRQAGVRA
jgi:hypothetical protein